MAEKTFFPTNEFSGLMSAQAQSALRNIENIQTILDNITALQKQQLADEAKTQQLADQITILQQQVQQLNTTAGALWPPWTNGQLPIGDTAKNALDKATLTAGSGMRVTNGPGSISLATVATVVVTVTNLPTPADGMRSFVTNATAATFGTAAAGGGTNHVPVYYDGGASSWKIG